MTSRPEVVITGVGVVSPIGVGFEAFGRGLSAGQSGVRAIESFSVEGRPPAFGGVITDFEPREHVRPLKSLKVMCRDIQLGVAAATMATTAAKITREAVDPERLGVTFGAEMMFCPPEEVADAYRACTREGRFEMPKWGTLAMGELYPLWMLKYLPNMPACHIGIAHDARGPNNTVVLGEVSSLLAIAEAMQVIERGWADVMITGGTGSRIHPTSWVRSHASVMSQRHQEPERACRPFDQHRDGVVIGEGAGALVLERREHAEARGATILGRLVAQCSGFDPVSSGAQRNGSQRNSGNNTSAASTGLKTALTRLLERAGAQASDVGHVNAHGLSAQTTDRAEAQAIQQTLGDIPVTAPKSRFGYLGAGSGAVELLASLWALQAGEIPTTLNYETPDPECPINVVHGKPLATKQPTAITLNMSDRGQSVAVLLTKDA